MAFCPGHTPAHKGKCTTTDPVKDPVAVARLKSMLAKDPRSYALWMMATNTALRAGDLVSLKWDDLEDNGETFRLHLRERKTKKPRVIELNAATSGALRRWRAFCESPFIYSGQRGQLTTATWGRLVKHWCESAGLTGNFAGHTPRKTFVRIQHDVHGTSLPTLMTMLNHSSERVTLTYMGRLEEDVRAAYTNEV